MKTKGASSVSVCTLLDKPARRGTHFQLFGEGKYYCGFEVISLSLSLSKQAFATNFVYHSYIKKKRFLLVLLWIMFAYNGSARITSWWATDLTLLNCTGTCRMSECWSLKFTNDFCCLVSNYIYIYAFFYLMEIICWKLNFNLFMYFWDLFVPLELMHFKLFTVHNRFFKSSGTCLPLWLSYNFLTNLFISDTK